MRTLKKTLALVLVVAMMLSFGVIGASAAFTDTSKVNENYAEAVDVLTGIKVIDGVKQADGTFAFDPTGTLTREQAAKIIAYVKLGATNAQLIGAASSSHFTDVESTRWSASYIEYCANINIIAGNGDGTFAPTDKLTTAAFTKMLLVAVGFDSANYTVPGWVLNVATDSIKANINDTSIAISDKRDITREEACQLAFLALDYSKSGTGEKMWTITGIVDGNVQYGWVTVPGTATDSLAASVFKLQRVPATANNGLSGHEWQVSGKAITGVYIDDVFVQSFPAGTTYAAITKAMGVTASFNKTAKWFANGVEKQSFTASDIKAKVDDTTGINAPIAIYKDADGNFKMMATYEYLAKVKTVTKLTGLNAGLDQVVFTVFDDSTGYDVMLGAEAAITTGTYKVGDLLIAVPKGDNRAATSFLSLTTPKTVDGKVTGTGDGYIRVDGTKYAEGQFNKVLGSSFDYNTSTYTFYLDSVGNIVGYNLKAAAPAASFDGILYLTAAEAKVVGASGSLFGNTAYEATAKASVIFAGEAAAKVIDLAIYTTYNTSTGAVTGTYVGTNTSGWNITTGYGTAAAIPDKAGFYGYNATANGYVLTAIADSEAADVSLTKNVASVISGKYADASTVVTVYNFDAVANNVSKTVYTGIAGYPASTVTFTDSANLIVVTYVKNSAGSDTNVVATIDVFTNVDTVTSTAVNYALYKAAGESYASGKSFQGFYVKGEYVEYKVSDTATITDNALGANKLYSITLDKDGIITAATEVAMTSDTVVYVGATYVVFETAGLKYISANYASYNIVAGHAGEADVLEAGDSVKFALVASGSTADQLDVAYIVG